MLLAHLSDTHFTTGPDASEPTLRGSRALGRIQALDPRPDCVLITGDSRRPRRAGRLLAS